MQVQSKNARGVSQPLMQPLDVAIDISLGLPVQVSAEERKRGNGRKKE
jgi:hypothetical protein